jgi:ankyrin repeat protein
MTSAAAEGQVEVVRCLLDYGADRSLEDTDGDTALALARQNGFTEVVELLEVPPVH